MQPIVKAILAVLMSLLVFAIPGCSCRQAEEDAEYYQQQGLLPPTTKYQKYLTSTTIQESTAPAPQQTTTAETQPATTSTEPANDAVEGVWAFNWVDASGKVVQEGGLLTFKNGVVTNEAGFTASYEVTGDPEATNVTIEGSSISEIDGKRQRSVMHLTLTAEATVLSGWAESDVVSESESEGGQRNVHRSDGLQRLSWGIMATRVSD
jgi:hypothetical protein